MKYYDKEKRIDTRYQLLLTYIFIYIYNYNISDFVDFGYMKLKEVSRRLKNEKAYRTRTEKVIWRGSLLC